MISRSSTDIMLEWRFPPLIQAATLSLAQSHLAVWVMYLRWHYACLYCFSPFPDLEPTHATPHAAPLQVRAAVVPFPLVEEAALTTRALAPTVLSTMTLVIMPMHSLTMTARVCVFILLPSVQWADNYRSDGYVPADFVVYTCPNTDITLTLCPGITSHYT